MEKRKYELSLANIICALLVMFIHLSSEAVTELNRSSLWYVLIYSLWQASAFVVYGFVFLSGVKLFLGGTDNFSIGKFYKNRFIKILVPYLLWVGIYYAYDCLHGVEGFNIKNLFYYIYSGDYVGHFYFVILIMQFYLLMPLWVWLFKRVSGKIMIPAAFTVTILCGRYLSHIWNFRFFDRAFLTYFFYFAAGAYLGLNYDKAVKILRKCRWGTYALFAVSLSLAIAAGLCQVKRGYSDIMLLYRIAAILFLITVCLGKVKNIIKYPFMKTLDLSTYNIYLCHIFFIRIINRFFADYNVWDMGARYLIRLFAVYVLSIGICWSYTHIKRRLL